MPSGQTIIDDVLTTLGILEQGGTPSVSDSNDALTELNAMWDAWQIDEGLVYSVQPVQASLSANIGSYTIGPGANFSATRPTRVYKGVIVATVGAGSIRRDLKIVEQSQYYGHGDLAAAASVPEELFPDYNVDASGFAKIYLWPVPKVLTATLLELEVGQPFTAWTLVGVTLLPYGYQDLVEKALALRLLPRYGGIVAPQVAQTIEAMGVNAERRIRAMNSKDRMLPAGAAELAPPQPPVAQQ